MLRAHETYYYQCNCTGTGASDFIGHDLDCNIVERASALRSLATASLALVQKLVSDFLTPLLATSSRTLN